MSAGWDVGDLALCVDDSPCRCGTCGGAAMTVNAGSVYRVDGVFAFEAKPYLTFEGVPAGARHKRGTYASRFRKILPDKHEPCEAEFVTLLKRSKVSA